MAISQNNLDFAHITILLNVDPADTSELPTVPCWQGVILDNDDVVNC